MFCLNLLFFFTLQGEKNGEDKAKEGSVCVSMSPPSDGAPK